MKKLLFVTFFMAASVIAFAQLPTDFVSIWKTSNENNNLTYWPDNLAGATNPSANNEIIIPLQGRSGAASYTVIWYDSNNNEVGNQTFTGNTQNDFKITWPSPGEYKVAIRNNTANAVKLVFGNVVTNNTATGNNDSKSKDRLKITDIIQWGNLTWSDAHAFNGCKNLDITANDIPVLTGNLGNFFQNCANLKGTEKFSDWNTANVTHMAAFFSGAKEFNQLIGNWNVSKVRTTSAMFSGATKFNQNLAGWSLEDPALNNVTSMFNACTSLSCENFTLTMIGWANNSNLTAELTLSNLPAGLTHGNMAAYNTLTSSVDGGGKGWTIYRGNNAANTLNFDAVCAATLPVAFANLKASLTNGELLVKWQTISEQNNDKFIIQLSKDGKIWKEAATVHTKAESGNSNEVIDYAHTIGSNALQLAGVPVFITLLLAVLLFSRRKRLFISMALLTGVFFTGCSKSELTLQEIEKGDIYVKITQIDKDGETTSDSNVVYVTKVK